MATLVVLTCNHCGAEFTRTTDKRRQKYCSISCGIAARNTTHGMKGHPLYERWKGMRARCNDPAHKSFHNYGGRGISICPEWDSFEQFVQDMGDCPEGWTLDRIDTDGDYTPTNCRWADDETQSGNRRNVIRYKGKSLMAACRDAGMSYPTVVARIKKMGWSVEKALTTPPLTPRSRRQLSA